jgi:hypothetical protein
MLVNWEGIEVHSEDGGKVARVGKVVDVGVKQEF